MWAGMVPGEIPGRDRLALGLHETPAHLISTTPPGDAPMFDMLTLTELYALHGKLHGEHMAIHRRMIEDGRPLIPVSGETWRMLGAYCDEIWETADGVYAEIRRRTAELHRAQEAPAGA